MMNRKANERDERDESFRFMASLEKKNPNNYQQLL